MMNINIDISNTLIGSYSLNAVYSKVQIKFSGIPEEWQGNRIYATFVQDNLDPTVEVIDNTVSVPSEILKTGTDFYVSVYSIAYGSSQVSEPSSPILITVDTTKSSEIDLIELIKSIVNLRSKLEAIILNKVDKVDGMGLSSNDFTDADKLTLTDTRSDMDKMIEEITMAKEKIDNKVDKESGKGLSSNDFTDDYITRISTAETKAENIQKDIDEIAREIAMGIWKKIYEDDARIYNLESRVFQTPRTTIPSTLEPNRQYNFGEVTGLSLTFPSIADDGDVVYLTFKSGATATNLTIDTTNTTDLEIIPESNMHYEIFGSYNGSVWLVNYSEYLVSEV
ncbi:MAG: hypothetical protein IJN40_01135 [Clostridia bacterium]|nr:hypothetical protein [Clostridia bacterium]